MEILGFCLAIIMGFTLGLLGGGGSILTVPILVYVLAIDPILATAYSLFVVGTSAFIGGWRKHVRGLVDWKTVFTFATPSLISVFLTRYYLVPAIPTVVFSVGDFTLTKDIAIMIFFAAVMLMASYSMIRGNHNSEDQPLRSRNIPVLIVQAAILGIVTGLVGAGGGFLIVPALVILVGLPIKKAIGTSLVIIAINSLIGFMGDIGSGQNIQWSFILTFTAFSIIGMLLGNYATHFVNPAKLKKGFGYFVLVMGIFIIVKETLL
ncbi:sulfite exporter TauE/SafE family protein [Owenweeksia hongkongensis]|uniref:sulfite exporter TauE/SafE family protein n=1 Tax=Owenweeksia hongkongensis TaxID=253245 RepID=UPI003A94D1D3